jgi:hypothetical protein
MNVESPARILAARPNRLLGTLLANAFPLDRRLPPEIEECASRLVAGAKFDRA